MKKLKVGVIGVGHLGKIHSRLWKENDFADLVGVYDIEDNIAEKAATEYNCGVFKTLDEAVDSVDAATISVPTTLHYEIADKFLRLGKHCLIEKPITSTYIEALELIKTATQNSAIIQVGHVERFNPALSTIKGILKNPRFIEAHRLSQFKPRAIDVSVVHDLMIHDIDIILWLVKSDVSSIDANGVSVLTDTTDIANARIKFTNGAVANITASRISASPMRKMRLFQKDTYISLDFGNQEAEIYQITDDGIKVPETGIPATMLGSIQDGLKNRNIYYVKPKVEQLNAISEEQNAFVNAVLKNEPVAVSAKEAAEALRIAGEIARHISN